MMNVKEIADKADVIISGYAIKKIELGYSVITIWSDKGYFIGK